MSLCGDGSIVAQGPGERVAITRLCRCWACENCAPGKLRQLFCVAMSGQATKFLTLTTRRREGVLPNEEAKNQSRWVHELMRRLAKRLGLAQVPYFFVREAHVSGWPHLHGLLRCNYVDWRWLKAEWLKITGSDRIRIEKPKSAKGAARYISKYLSKAPGRFGTAKRWWKSRNYQLPDAYEKKPRIDFGAPWERRNECIITLAEAWAMDGWTIEWSKHHSSITARPP